jgi:hypothetical protein
VTRFPIAMLCFLLLLLALLPPQPRLPAAPPSVGKTEAVHRVYLPLVAYSEQLSKKGIGGGSVGSDVGGSCERAALLGAAYRREWGIFRATCTNGVKTVVCVRDVEQAELALSSGSIGGDTSIVLGFNEPDLKPPEGSQMTPHQGAAYWHALTAAFPSRSWASPASALNSQWLEQMYAEHVSQFGVLPRFDYIDFHCYSYSAERCEQMARGYIALADRWGVQKLIVSETQIIVGNEGEAYALQETRRWLAWLEAEPRIEWYAWFCGACRQGDYPFYWPSRLMDRDGALTPFGAAFVGAGK